jgi:hypothetical protein
LVGGPFFLKASNWTPAFAGETDIRKAWFFVVIPAEAGIQDDLKKMKSRLYNFGLISKSSFVWQRPLSELQLLY